MKALKKMCAQSAETARSRAVFAPAVVEQQEDLSRHSSARALSRNGSSPVALVDLTLPQLAEAAHGLERLEREYENMSGICATLKGLVLVEAKKRLGHGKFMPWVKENFVAHRTATAYMRLAQAFMGKLASTCQFKTLTKDLAASLTRLRDFQLDLSHPVVSEVAKWVKGRGSYQLMLDFAGSAGGDTSWSRKKLSPEEERKQAIERCRETSVETFNGVYGLLQNERWQFGLTDAELQIAADAMRELARKISAWLREPKKQREATALKRLNDSTDL